MATIEKRGNSYKIIVSCGYDSSGKQLRRSMTWVPESEMTARQIEKELERQKVLFEEKCKSGQYVDGSIKFADFADRWFKDYAELHLKPKTLSRYKRHLERVNAAIGHIQLEKLQPQHLLAFYKNLQEPGIKNTQAVRCKIDLKDYLKANNLTKVTLIERADVSISTLNSVTQGKNISWASACKICTALSLNTKKTFEPVNPAKGLSAKTVQNYHRVYPKDCVNLVVDVE